MSELLRFFKDMRDNGYGLAEIAAQLGTSAIAEPVAGFAAMYDPVHGADAIREGMTYQPRTQEAQQYSQSVGNAAKTAIKPAMPIIDTWKKGVDIAGQYSPVVGAGLRTVPAAIGIAMGAKPALQAGRQVSEGLGAMQGRMVANANAPRTLNTGYMGQRGVFAGINALTADRQALAKAQQMIAQGVDPADVWKQTGWGQGADGKWRFEINDKFDFNDNMDEIGSSLNYGGQSLSDLARGQVGVARGQQILNHNDLYAAYPEFRNIAIRRSVGNNSLGSIDAGGENVTLNGKLLMSAIGGRDLGRADNAHSVLLHELQHGIQAKEGFASGGSPSQFEGIYNDPHEAYRKLGGEVEARMVQNRMDLTPEQRRDIYPFAIGRYGYEDIPKSQQIINFGNNKANAQRPLTEFEQAHLTAQRNAALPVEKGGLGLAPDNTAMDRARAMGFDADAYHGTNTGFDGFNASGWSSTSPSYADNIASRKSAIYGGNEVNMPLLVNNTNAMYVNSQRAPSSIIEEAANSGYSGVVGDGFYINSPKNIRSRFAAFDPFNRESSNLLATTAPLVPTTALGAYMYNENRKKSQGKQ